MTWTPLLVGLGAIGLLIGVFYGLALLAEWWVLKEENDK